jgi:hypothetical protein
MTYTSAGWVNGTIVNPRASNDSRMRWVSYWFTLHPSVVNAAVAIGGNLPEAPRP